MGSFLTSNHLESHLHRYRIFNLVERWRWQCGRRDRTGSATARDNNFFDESRVSVPTQSVDWRVIEGNGLEFESESFLEKRSVRKDTLQRFFTHLIFETTFIAQFEVNAAERNRLFRVCEFTNREKFVLARDLNDQRIDHIETTR